MQNRIRYKSLVLVLSILILIFGNFFTVYAEDYDEGNWDEVDESIYVTADGKYYYYQNDETGYVAIVEDDANRLSDEEEYYLLYYMCDITYFGDVYYKSIDHNPYHNASDYAREYLNKEKRCYGGGSGIVFLDDTVNRRLEIFSNGEIYRYITKGKAVSITDNVYRYASAGNYYECAAMAFDEIEIILYGGSIAEPMKYTSNFFLSIIISLTLCFIVAVLTSRTRKASNFEIMNAATGGVSFTNVKKTFRGQTRKYDPPSSSSSGGGSSGGGGGGGGGGGHGY